jgi:hypothetical protein
MPISRKIFSKKRVKKSMKKNTRKYNKRMNIRKHKKTGNRVRFFGGMMEPNNELIRYMVQLESSHRYNGRLFLNNNDLIQEIYNNLGANIGINEIATQIRQLILQTLNYNFDLQLQENDIDVLVDGNRLVMQVQPNLEQYINRIEIKNGLPNFIAEMIFVRMNNLTSDMNGEVNQDALIEPMQNLNIQEDNQQL